MPLYTYRCNDCEHEFEVRQRMVDDALTICPVCGGAIRRVVSSVGVVFKGSGFYVTDNRSGSVNGGSSTKSSSHAKSGESSSDSTTKTTAATESSGSSSTSESSSKSPASDKSGGQASD